MKRYILSIMCCMATIILFAQYPGYPDCERITDFSPTISRWGAAYQPVASELQCWEIDLGVQGHTKITYNIDLELVAGLDQILIYELDNNFQTTRMMRSFFACTTSGTLITNSTTGKIKIEYWGFYGNCDGLYNGFQIRVEQATCCDLVSHDHYILGKLGIGTTQPQEMLHVKGALKLTSTYGNLTLGKMDTNYVHFNTDMSGFSFNKPLYLQNTAIRGTGNALMFYTHTNTLGMTILHNRVGIGTQNPLYKLDVAGTIRANEIIVNTTGADFVFADDYQLRPLSEVKAFIKENKHLPEIKSAQEMQENGIGVNELQTQLLQKIEELTLYILQQEEVINDLNYRINKLEEK